MARGAGASSALLGTFSPLGESQFWICIMIEGNSTTVTMLETAMMAAIKKPTVL